MRLKSEKPKPQRPPRYFPEAIDEILWGYGSRARVVQLWRRRDNRPDEWTYLGRLRPAESQIELVARRFGGGWYRAKIFGVWDPDGRREQYLEQVSFSIDQHWWPMTPETRDRIRKQHGI